VWLFCKDLECNFLLNNSAGGGRMPRHLQLESGFDVESVSSLGDNTPPNRSSQRSKKRKVDDLEEQIIVANDQYKSINNALTTKVTDYLDDKKI